MELPYEFLPISELINLHERGRLKNRDFLSKILEKIDSVQGTSHPFVRLNPNLQAEFDELDRSKNFIVPFSVKDLFDTEGIETNYGSEIFKGNVPGRDARAVSRIRKKGCILLGKTVTHEFALGIVSAPSRNPWDLSRIPGGSSGGSAVAVAEGVSPFSLGSDTGGSVRIPAAMCGVTGLKPTNGLIPKEGVFPESFALDCVGLITRYASDLKYELEMAAGLGKLKNNKLKEKRYRVAVAWEMFENTNNSVNGLSRKSIERIENELGYSFDGISPDRLMFKEMLREHEIIDCSEIAYVHRELYSKNPGMYLKSSVSQIREGNGIRANDYIGAIQKRRKYARLFDELFTSYDIILTPALPDTAPTVKEMSSDPGNLPRFDQFLAPINYSGNPALTIPIGFSRGLPVGMQIISRNLHDLVAVDFASGIQSVTGWHTLHPNVIR